MFNREKIIIDNIIKDKNILFFVIINIISFFIRIIGFKYITGDMYYSFMAWFDYIKQNGGVSALSNPIGDYSILFLTLIATITYIPGLSNLYLLKLTFVIFDYFLAYFAAQFFCELSGNKKFSVKFNILYAAVLFLPTIVINSAYWGQCDAIYTTFILLTLIYLYKEKYKKAFFFLGIAFSFKLQTVFIIPFIVCLYMQKRNFSALNFGITCLTVWFSGIISYINGGSLISMFNIYSNQINMFQKMWLNFPSFWIILGNDYTSFGTMAKFTTIMVCAIGIYLVISGIKRVDTSETFLNTAIWFTWSMLLLLPAMHERYAYLLDVLLIVLCFINIIYIKFAVASSLSSLLAYSSFLFGKTNIINELFALIYAGVWFYYTYLIIEKDIKERKA